MTVSKITTSFRQGDGGGASPKYVIQDGTAAQNGPLWSAGAQRIAEIATQPTQSSKWSILGFSGRIRMVWMDVTQGIGQPGPFGYPGDVWMGLATDSNIQDSNANIAIPSDLTTFAKIFDGQNDSPEQYPVAQAAANTAPLGTVFVAQLTLPVPLELSPGSSSLKMALILMPSLVYQVELHVVSADCTILYEETLRK